MDNLNLGAKIKARREELGLSQQDLAKALDLDQGKVSLIERGGRKISASELPLLAKVLKRPISWFYSEDMEIPQEVDPVEIFLRKLFPDVQFTEFQKKRIGQFLEPVLESYVKTDPELGKQVNE